LLGKLSYGDSISSIGNRVGGGFRLSEHKAEENHRTSDN